MMKMFYITLNHEEEAKEISEALLKNRYAVCTNWFPIRCAYLWEGEIKYGNEVVLIVKTNENKREAIERILAKHIHYTNYVAEIDVESVNESFQSWLENALSINSASG